VVPAHHDGTDRSSSRRFGAWIAHERDGWSERPPPEPKEIRFWSDAVRRDDGPP
jgi:hypothetical protein